jgi:trimeric autotransporter adhesin
MRAFATLMKVSSKVWVRLAVGGLLSAALVSACGSKDDKDKAMKSYPGDGGAGADAAKGGTKGSGGSALGGDNGAGQGGALGSGAAGAQPPGAGGAEPGAGADGVGGDGGAGGADVGPLGPAVLDPTGRGSTGPLLFEITTLQSPAVVGQHVTYSITIGNTSDVAVDGVNVLMRIPVGLSLLATSDCIPDSGGCYNYVCASGAEATWTLGTIPAHSTRTILASPSVIDTVGDGDAIAPLFRLNATGLDTLNLTKSTPVQAAPSAEVTLTADADPVVPGQSVEVSVDIGQIGATPLAGAELHLVLPGGLLVESISDAGTKADGEITWPIGSMAVGASLHRSLTVKVHPQAIHGDVLNPRADFSFDGGLATDNVAELPISVVPTAEPLALTVSALNSPAAPGGSVLYQMTVANTALRPIDNIQLALQVPPELSYDSPQDSQPDSSGCYNYICNGGAEGGWNIGTLQPGTSQTVTLNASVLANAAADGTLVTVPFALSAPGVNQVNQVKTVPVFSKAAAQLVLGTAVAPVTPGQTFSYDLDVGQVGAAALSATTLTAYLPGGVSVGAVSDGGTNDAGVVTWALGKLPVAGTLHRSVDVTVAGDAPAGSTLFARARLAYTGGAEIDAQSEYPVSIVADALPLGVTLDAVPGAAVPGGRVLYTTSIKNSAARAVDGVSLLLRVPQFSYVSTTDADPDSGGCYNFVCATGAEGVWALGSIKAGGSSVVTLNPTIAASLIVGSLVVSRQTLTGTALGGTIFLQKTLPSKAQ